MIQTDLYNSYNILDFGDKIFNDDSFCNYNDDKLVKPDKKLYKSVNLVDNFYLPSRSKSDSEILQYKQRSSKFQVSDKVPEVLDLPDTHTAYDSPPFFANQSSCLLLFNQSEDSNRKTRTKND